MSMVSNIRNSGILRPSRLLLGGTMLVLAGVSAWFIALSSGLVPGILLILLVLGIGICFLTLFYPVIGFYLSIVICFFIFDIIRLFRIDMPVGTLIDVLIFLTFLGVVLNKIVSKERFWKNCRHPVVVCYLLLLLFTAVEIFNPNGGSLVLVTLIIRRVVTLFLFFYCSLQLFTDLKAIHFFLKMFIGLCVVAALYSCYEQFFGLPRYELEYIQSNPIGEQLSSLGNGDYRKSSFLSDFTSYGILLSSITIVVVSLLFHSKRGILRKGILAGTVILLLLALSFTGTRTAFFMFTVEVALYILMTLLDRRTLIFAGISAVLFVIVLFGPIYGNATINRIRTTFLFSREESLNVRDVNRHGIQPYIYAHPIGGGLGTTGMISLEYNPEHPLAGFPTDSGLLRIALEYGWVGLILQCGIYFVIVQQGVRAFFRSRNPHYKMLILGATSGLFGYVVAQYAQVAIGTIPGAFLFFGLIAVIIRLQQIEQLENSANK